MTRTAASVTGRTAASGLRRSIGVTRRAADRTARGATSPASLGQASGYKVRAEREHKAATPAATPALGFAVRKAEMLPD